MEVERVVVAVDVRHLMGQAGSYGCAVESLVRRILSMVSSSNTMWAFTFLDSLASGPASSVLGRAGTASFASPRHEGSIKAFRECLDKLLLGDLPCARDAAARWAFHVANALLPLLTAYSWDPLLADDDGDREEKSVLPPVTCRNLLLVLSSAPAPQELHTFLSATSGLPDDERRIASLHKLLEKKNVHAVWFQPPGDAAALTGLLQVARSVKSSSPSSSWGFSSVDTFLVATLVMPHRLLLPMLLLPLLFPSGTQRRTIPPAELRVRISNSHHFVCHIGIRPLEEGSSGSSSLDVLGAQCSKIRLGLKAVMPCSDRAVQQQRVVDTYVVYQHRGSSGVELELGSARHELLRRLEHLPEELVCRRHHDLSLMLLLLARQDAVALVNVEVQQGETARPMQGVLEPLTISAATLRIVTGEDALASSRVSNDTSLAKRPCTRLLSGSWNEAWSWCLKVLLQKPRMDWMDPMFRESMYPEVLKAWKKQGLQKSTSGLDEQVAMIVAASETEPGPGDCKQQEQDDSNAARDVSSDMALSYLSSLAERLEDCISAGNFDVAKLVRDTAAALKATRATPETLHNLLLQGPKELSSKYTHGSSTHSTDHKLNEFTLQIQLRLEMLAAGEAPGMEAKFMEHVCDLLYDVQFSLGGDICGEEEVSLVRFADRVVRSSYDKLLPRIVDDIYTRMEFLGYGSGEPDAVEEAVGLVIAAEEAQANLVSQGDSGGSSSTAHQSTFLEEQKQVVRSGGDDGAQAKPEMERARKLSHFSGLTQKLRFVKKARLASATPRQKTTVDSVPETPHFQLCSSKPKRPGSLLPRPLNLP